MQLIIEAQVLQAQVLHTPVSTTLLASGVQAGTDCRPRSGCAALSDSELARLGHGTALPLFTGVLEHDLSSSMILVVSCHVSAIYSMLLVAFPFVFTNWTDFEVNCQWDS